MSLLWIKEQFASTCVDSADDSFIHWDWNRFSCIMFGMTHVYFNTLIVAKSNLREIDKTIGKCTN